MKHTFLILTMLLVAIAAPANGNAGKCEMRENYLKAALEHSISPTEVLDLLLADDPQVINIGENHYHEEGRMAYPDIYKKIASKDPAFDCVFLEHQNRQQKYLDQYVQLRRENSAETRRAYLADWVLRNSRKNVVLESAETFLNSLIDTGVRIILADANGERSITERNSVMADRILQSFNTGECRKALVINGKNHLKLDLGEPDSGKQGRSIPQLLRGQNINVKAVNLQATKGPSILYLSEWIWEECPWNPPASSEPFGFISPTGGQYIPLHHKVYPGWGHPTWGAFDATLVFPNRHVGLWNGYVPKMGTPRKTNPL